MKQNKGKNKNKTKYICKNTSFNNKKEEKNVCIKYNTASASTAVAVIATE